MNIKIETVDGKTKYWVNEVSYDSIKDIPDEYQSQFADKDGNGMPDQFDSLMNTAKGMSDGKSPIKGLFETLKSTNFFDEGKTSSTSTSSTKINDYSYQEEKSSILPTILKIVGVGLVLLLIWAYPRLKEAYQNRDTYPALNEAPASDSLVSVIAPVVSDQFILSVEDPNSPPYRMLGVGTEKGAVTFSFQLPDGKITTSNDVAIEVEMPVEEGTNLLERNFSMEVSSGACTIPEEASTNIVSINGIDFTRAEYGDSGAGQRYTTIDYYTERGEKCFRFSMIFHSGVITEENSVKEFDLAKQLIPLESILWSIRFD